MDHPEKLKLNCRFRDETDIRCFFHDHVYAHNTNMAFKDTILKTGLHSMPVQARMHQCLASDTEQSCKYRGILDKVTDARDKNVFLYANFLGAAEHSVYNRRQSPIPFTPVIILADLSDKPVQLDVENFTSMIVDVNRDPLPNIVEYYFAKGSNATRIPVSTKSPIPAERILGWCKVNEAKLQRTPNKARFFESTNFAPYGFEYDEKRYGVKKPYNSLSKQSHEFLEAMKQAKRDYWEEVLSKKEPSMEWYYQYEHDAMHYAHGLYDYKNWDCYKI